MQCKICLDIIIQSQATTILQCNDTYCTDCLQGYLKNKIIIAEVEQIRCPRQGCLTLLDEQFIKQNSDSDTYRKYQSFLKVNILNSDPLIRWCPKIGCEKYVKGQKKSKKVTCECGQEICFQCNNSFHGLQSCEDSSDSSFKQAMKEYDKNIYQFFDLSLQQMQKDDKKNIGCNHITCSRCNYQFCWMCKKIYFANHYNKWNYWSGCPNNLFLSTAPHENPFFRNIVPITKILIFITSLLTLLYILPSIGFYVISFLNLVFYLISIIQWTLDLYELQYESLLLNLINYCVSLTGPALLYNVIEIQIQWVKMLIYFSYSSLHKKIVFLIWIVLGVILNSLTIYLYKFLIIVFFIRLVCIPCRYLGRKYKLSYKFDYYLMREFRIVYRFRNYLRRIYRNIFRFYNFLKKEFRFIFR